MSKPYQTYTRKPLPRASVQFDAIISGHTSGSGRSASAAAVSVTRWGQTTFTSVRRQREASALNGNTDVLKKARIETDSNDVLKELPPKPRVNKFFKSRANVLFDEIVKDKIIKDKEESKIMMNERVIQSQQTIHAQQLSPSKGKYHRNNDKKSDVLDKKSVIKSKFIESDDDNDNDDDNNSIPLPMIIQSSDSSSSPLSVKCESDYNSDNNLQNEENDNNKKCLIAIIANRGTRQSRRLKGDAPEVVNADVNRKKTQLFTFDKSTVQLQTSEERNFNDDNNTNAQIVDYNLVDVTKDSDNDSPPMIEPIQPQPEPLKFAASEESLPSPQSTHSQSQSNNPQMDDIDVQPLPLSQPSSSSVPIALPKPKKRIFSSKSKTNRAVVFNVKNFWTAETSDMNEFDEEIEPLSGPTPSSSSVSNNTKKSNDIDFEDNEIEYIKWRRVKKANQCHDLGETEQFDDDIRFYLSGIEVSNSPSMRCLSIIGLSQQTMRPEFRLHLRAHDDMPKIISALMDAPNDPNLALCTATLMFVYNQGRLNMDIEANALSLMLQLLETRSDECQQVEERHRHKVKSLCEEMKKAGHAQYLNLNEITAGKLAMETLLGLTSKRANSDVLKDEMRRLKGIDFILNTVMRCSEFDNDEGFMIKIDRCMHVLENLTLDHLENQLYILNFENGQSISTCIKLLHSCKTQIILSNDFKIFLSAFFSILRVLTHLTSESVEGCSVIGSYDGIMDLLLESLLELPSFILSDQRFDLMVILLCLCINLLEFCPSIRCTIIDNKSRLTRIIEILFQRIDDAQKTEQQADELLESHETIQMNEAIRDSILTQILAKSGKHMEHSIIAACISLLLGCAIQDNYRYNYILRDHLPDSSFDQLVEVLQKLRDFAYLADIMTAKGKERVERIIQVFKTS